MKQIIAVFSLFILFQSCDTDSEPSRSDWKRVSVPTNASLKKLFFVNENVGFVGSEQKATLHSSNYRFMNGEYFSYIEDVHIITNESEYVRVDYAALNPEPVLFKTGDGGETWVPVATPFISGVVDIYFTDELNGYVATEFEGVYSTTTGGSSWVRVLSNVAFFGSGRIVENPFKRIHAVGVGSFYAMAFDWNNNAVVKTKDGGISWELVPSFELDCMCGNKKISFTTGQTGFAITTDKGFLTTEDGGSTWQKVDFSSRDLDPAMGHTVVDFDFVNALDGFLIVDGNIYRTQDGGRNLERIFDLYSGNRVHAKNADELFVLYETIGEARMMYFNTATNEARESTVKFETSILGDWFVVGDKAFVAGTNGFLAKWKMR